MVAKKFAKKNAAPKKAGPGKAMQKKNATQEKKAEAPAKKQEKKAETTTTEAAKPEKAEGKKQLSKKNKKFAKKGDKGPKKQESKQEKKAKVDVSDLTIDEETKYEGVCVYFDRSKGFGFLKMDTSDVIPEDKVMVHWKSIASDDRWPYLIKGTKCEFTLKKMKKRGEMTVGAMNVAKPGGDKFEFQTALEDKKDFVGDKFTRYLGNVKWYDFEKGFGFVALQDGYDVPEDVPTDLVVNRMEINSGGDAPRLRPKMEVEFGIQKNKSGKYAVYNVTLPGGDELSRTAVEGRGDLTDDTFQGEVVLWAWQRGFGFIKPDDITELSKELQEALEKDHAKRAKKSGKGEDEASCASLYFRSGDKASRERLRKGDRVAFKIYKDARGVGASEVTRLGGAEDKMEA